MKRLNMISCRFLLCSVMICGVFTAGKTMAQTGQNYFIQAEDFQFPGEWTVSKEAGTNVSGKGALLTYSSSSNDPKSDAFTVIKITSKADYVTWTRSRDYAQNAPKTRQYRLYCNDQAMTLESGMHGEEGYHWENVGKVSLEAGDNLLQLKKKTNFARCDAIFFTTDESFNPNLVNIVNLQRFAITPVQVKENHAVVNTAAPSAVGANETVLGTLANDQIRLKFKQATDSAGKSRIAAVTEVFQDGQWTGIGQSIEEHRIFLVKSKTSKIKFTDYYASWMDSILVSTFTVNGKTYQTIDLVGYRNPFLSGKLLLCTPSAITQTSPGELAVTYTAADGTQVTGTWKLKPGTAHLELSLQYSATEDGFYSFGVSSFQGVPDGSVKNVQLPPMFNYKRVPELPVLVAGAMTPQPLSIVELVKNNKPLTMFVTGSLSDFPLDWAQDTTSRIGFALKGELNTIQPIAFAPLLGLTDSRLLNGQTLKRTFNIGSVSGNWNTALEYISNNIYQVKDYRLQDSTSLTNAAFNIIDLLKNDDASGWNTGMKGFYDIEADPKYSPTVAQAAPLATISAAVLTRDEDLYIRRALPTIEYTLSRSAFRWARAVGAPFNIDSTSLELNPYKNIQFNTAYFEALHQLLGAKNPWLTQVAMPNGLLRKSAGYSVNVPDWTQELAAYKLTNDPQWLTKAVLHAKDFVQKEVYGSKTNLLTVQSFYNTSFYPYWWDLMDLYEVNKEQVFLDAAEYSSFFTMAGIRSYPLIEDKLQLIHPGNRYEGNTNLWWKDTVKFRLGFPRHDGDVQEKMVPQSLISPVGLGLEQPVTFFLVNKNVRHIFMSTWSPHLLRVSAYRNRSILETYARNGIIGRFSNYPGYYATGFTDLTYGANYPYVGPDINSIYYHHISPHLAFTLDFLFTEAIQRSAGRISFPWGKQEGFVWFNNRIFGAGKGTIFGDSLVRPWLVKGLVKIDTPQINYISGISNDRFWLVLLNESKAEKHFDITVDTLKTGIKTTGIKWYKGASAEPGELSLAAGKLNVTLAGKASSAYSFPLANPGAVQELPAVKNGLKTDSLGKPWGTLYAFRIRSPFGWDSIYAYLSNYPITGTTAELTLNGTISAGKRTVYPFEWTFTHVDPQAEVNLMLDLKKNGGETRQVCIKFEGLNN
jgi:hypothetical protein